METLNIPYLESSAKVRVATGRGGSAGRVRGKVAQVGSTVCPAPAILQAGMKR